MTKFKKVKCPNCNNIQLENKVQNNLIIKIVCRECGHTQTLCNILGLK